MSFKITNELSDFIKSVECEKDEDKNPILNKTIYLDTKGIPTIGVGHALMSDKGKVFDLPKEITKKLSEDDLANLKETLGSVSKMLSEGKSPTEIEKEYGNELEGSVSLEVGEIDGMLERDIEKHHERGIEELAKKAKEGGISKAEAEELYNELPEGAKIAFDSLSFNNPGSLIGPKISAAIAENNLGEMFYETAFNWKKDVVDEKGLRNRRFQEGEQVLEGILEGGVTKEEAEQLRAMVA